MKILATAFLSMLILSCSQAPNIAAIDFLELERTPCYGTCPVFTVRIQGDGQIRWKGKAHVQARGEATSTINPEVARTLLADIQMARLSTLVTRADEHVKDAPGAKITLRVGANEERISYFDLEFDDEPPQNRERIKQLQTIARKIETAANTYRWIHGDSRKEVFSLFGFPMTSEGSIGPLMAASAAEFSQSKKAMLLVDAGADVNVQDKNGRTALMFALMGSLVSCGSGQNKEFEQRLATCILLRAAAVHTDLRDAQGPAVIDLQNQQLPKWPTTNPPADQPERAEEQYKSMRTALQIGAAQ